MPLKIGHVVSGRKSPWDEKTGTVTAMVGTGHKRKWKIKWNDGQEGNFHAKSMLIKGRAPYTTPATCTSSPQSLLPAQSSCSSGSSAVGTVSMQVTSVSNRANRAPAVIEEHSSDENTDDSENDCGSEDGDVTTGEPVQAGTAAQPSTQQSASSIPDASQQRIAHGQEWNDVPNTYSVPSSQVHTAEPAIKWKPLLNVNEVEQVALHYYLQFFPTTMLETIVSSTNEVMATRGGPLITASELLKFIGVLYKTAQYPAVQRRHLWRSDKRYRADAPVDLGKLTDMSLTRFDDILRCCRLSSYTDEDLRQDPWRPIRPFLDTFNKERAAFFIPGTDICIDESFSWWLGKDGTFRLFGLPHVTKEKRKPKGCRCRTAQHSLRYHWHSTAA